MRIGACLLIVVCTTACFVQAQDDSESAVRTRIIALEKAWNQAYKAGDIRAPRRGRDPRSAARPIR